MAGQVAGTRGPIPKRAGTRLGHTSTNEAEGAHITRGRAAENVVVPRAHKDWDPVTKRWWKSLAQSGQSDFYEPSDWAYAYFLADQMSYYQKNPKGRSSMMLTSILSGMTGLLLTEGDRRRARIELEKAKPEEKSAAQAAIEMYENQLRSVPSGGSVEPS